MRLKDKIPADFYKLFASKYREAYMAFLLAIYGETLKLYSAMSLTESQCRAVIDEVMEDQGVCGGEEEEVDGENAATFVPNSSSFLYRLTSWGWLKRDFDERTNTYFYSFPDYALPYLDAFGRLESPQEDLSHESIRSIYSLLYTYRMEREKDPRILADALRTSRRLLQLLSNMQDGMRVYFDELSKEKEIRGVQRILVEELNNTNSKKYALLTSTDSFYRYKEAVKEVTQEILEREEAQRDRIEETLSGQEETSARAMAGRRRLEQSLEAERLIYEIEREFDFIEVRYNKLIEQKAIFAARANARIRYLIREGEEEDDRLAALIGLVREAKGERREALVAEIGESLGLTALGRVVSEESFFAKREERRPFEPAVVEENVSASKNLEDFVVSPEYTQKEIDAFIRKNSKQGHFTVTEDTVQSVEDLEKLLFVWRDAASGDAGMHITGTEPTTIHRFGYKYTVFSMEKGDEDHA